MNIHELYKDTYHKHLTYKWLAPNMFGNQPTYWHIQSEFKPLFDNKFLELYKEKYPKNKKPKNKKPVTVEFINKVNADTNHKDYDVCSKTYEYVNELIADYLTTCIDEHKKNKDILFTTILPTIELTIEPVLHEIVNSSIYNSQGFGANKYAKQTLILHELACEANNIPFEIKEVKLEYSTSYEFWCNCEKYQLFYLMINSNLDYTILTNLCWKRGLNPKVLFPFIPDNIYYNSLENYGK